MELRSLLEGCALGDDPAAQYAVLEGGASGDFAVLRPRIDLTALQTAMQYAQQLQAMSQATEQLLLAAQLLFCLRRAVKEKDWEPRIRFPLGGCDADEILAAVSGPGDDSHEVHRTVSAYTAAWAADQPDTDRDQLIGRIQSATAAAPVTETETVTVTVMEAFQFYNAANYAEDFAKRSCFAREFESLRRLALDRTIRLLLFVSFASNLIHIG